MAAEVHCQQPPAGAKSLANYLHDASGWLVIAMVTAGLNITAGVASQRTLNRRITYSRSFIQIVCLSVGQRQLLLYILAWTSVSY